MTTNQTTTEQAVALEKLRAALDEATLDEAATTEGVVAAVRYMATLVRQAYPTAQRLELVDSDHGDWLIPVSIDGDSDKSESLEDALFWAASHLCDKYRSVTPGLHSASGQLLLKTGELYIDIAEALNE